MFSETSTKDGSNIKNMFRKLGQSLSGNEGGNNQ